ncbi:hypothetical protein D3C87_1824280 [compost metagenome]
MAMILVHRLSRMRSVARASMPTLSISARTRSRRGLRRLSGSPKIIRCGVCDSATALAGQCAVMNTTQPITWRRSRAWLSIDCGSTARTRCPS